MSIENRLSDALKEFDRVEPSLDLFDRVHRSLAEDIAHRRRVRSSVALTLGSVSAFALLIIAVSSQSSLGTWVAPRWVFVVSEFVIMVTIVVCLGPAIGRFGEIFVAGVFGIEAGTGRHFLQLLDVAYYLAFGGYTLLTTSTRGFSGRFAVALQLSDSLSRVGGLLLIMGLLHAVTLTILPVIGLVHASLVRQYRRAAAGASAPSVGPNAERAERLVRRLVWIGLGLSVMGVTLVVGLVLGLGIAG